MGSQNNRYRISRPHEQPKVYSPSFMNLAVNSKGERERGLKREGGLQNFLIIPLKWGELILGAGGLLRGNLQGDLRSIERGESRPRDLLVTNTP